MNAEIIEALKKCKVFSSLDPDGDIFLALANEFETFELNTGEILFRQGDPSTNLYLLFSGKLEASLVDEANRVRIVGHILPNETVGEVGALTGDPRTLTLKATEKSVLLRMPGKIFQRLCRQFPSILFETLHPVIDRSQEIIQMLSSSEKKKHVAIIPANQDVDLTEFAETMQKVIDNYRKVILINENELHSEDISLSKVEETIRDAERKNAIIIYLLKHKETPLAKRCWDRISKVFIVGYGEKTPHFDNFALEKYQNKKFFLDTRRELVLLYPEDRTPQHTDEWLAKADFILHHQVRLGHLPDYQRLMRFVRGKAFGLVLGGGGAKGWAHMGVLKALIQRKIPIDAIGGVSVGALIGSLYALNYSYNETYANLETILKSTHNIVSWRNICWPAISLFSCKDFTNEIKKTFGHRKIENLWFPFFTVSCNLTSYRETVHNTGLIWEKTRATVAVPGLVPPMVIDGEMHFDGGVVNNLPVNVMRDVLGPESKIIAVELTSGVDDRKSNFPPTLTFKEAFLAKMHLGYSSYKFPPFFETFIRTLLVGSFLRQKENAGAADLLIDPDTRRYRMLRLVSDAQREELTEIGYRLALMKIDEWDYKK